jgi:hypothetical protein
MSAYSNSFKDFLLKNKRNRIYLILVAVAIVIQIAIFKYLYPYANYIHSDSFSYIKAADQNLSINTYLIGYSKFLRLFSVISTSDFALFIFQFLLVQCSMLFLLLTVFYFYKPGRILQILLLTFMICNPLALHLSNLVSSDALFLAVSMFWFSLLLWTIHQPSWRVIIWHMIFLFIAFTIRYNAMIYPVISFLAFLLSKLTWRHKIIGIGVGLLACLIFIEFTSYQYKKLTGYWQYSPFSGWQLTNNAMYAYRYVDSSEREPVPQKYHALDKMIREYFDTTKRNKSYHRQELFKASTVYMWTKRLTLYRYRESIFKTDTGASEFIKWATMGPLYKGYGLLIIRKYPWHFTRYFLWPNTLKYYAPPVEFLEVYNSNRDTVDVLTKKWFDYKSLYVKTRMDDNRTWILNYYQILSGIINLTMLILIIFFLVLKGWNYHPNLSKGVLLSAFFWLCNAVFTIFASSAALRFQSFPILLTSIFVPLLFDWMILMGTSNSNVNKSDTDNMLKEKQYRMQLPKL